MPDIGLGTWTMTDQEAANTVPLATGLGYRMIDTAALYQNEKGVGEGVRRSEVPRDQLFVVSKLAGRDHGYDRTLRAYDESLARLGLDYLDLYLIHWPLPMRDEYVDTWRAFARLLADGRVRAIGVCNFLPAYLERIDAEVGVRPAVNQIQLNPRVVQRESRAYAAEHGIAVQTWRPLCQGDLLTEPIVCEVARKHGKTAAQVVLRWHVEQGLVPIPKSVNAKRLAANIDIFDFRLTTEEVAAISGLDGTEVPDDPATTEIY
jgi:diketogulonate reductase-like aldo/keto reductase